MRENRMKASRLLIAALEAALLYGCGKVEWVVDSNKPDSSPGTTPANGPAPASTGAALTQAELDAVPKAGKPYKMALIVKTRNNPFFDPMIKAAEAEAKALGVDLEVQAPAQETDKERQ